MSVNNPTCPIGCNSILPIVDFDICDPKIYFGEIEDIYVAAGDASAFIDWTNANEWAIRLSDSDINDIDAIRQLHVIADIPVASADETIISLGRKVFSPATHNIAIDIDDISDLNYEFARATSCNTLYRVWFATKNYMFGGNEGILANINLRPVIERGQKSINKLSGTISWDSKFSPERGDLFNISDAPHLSLHKEVGINTNIKFSIAGINGGEPIAIYWGDGTSSLISDLDGNYHEISHEYTDSSIYDIDIYNYINIEKFICDAESFNYNNGLYGSIEQFSLCTNLIALHIIQTENISWSGSINMLPSGLIELSLVKIGGTCTGSIDNLSLGIIYLRLDNVGLLTGALTSLNVSMLYLSLTDLGTGIAITDIPFWDSITYIKISCGYLSPDIDVLVALMSGAITSAGGQIFLGGNETPTYTNSANTLDVLESMGFVLDFGEFGNEWALFHYIVTEPETEPPHTINEHIYVRFKKPVQSVGEWSWWDVEYCTCTPTPHIITIDTPHQTTEVLGLTNKWVRRYFETAVAKNFVSALTNYTDSDEGLGIVFDDLTTLPSYSDQAFCNMSSTITVDECYEC